MCNSVHVEKSPFFGGKTQGLGDIYNAGCATAERLEYPSLLSFFFVFVLFCFSEIGSHVFLAGLRVKLTTWLLRAWNS